MDKIAESIAKNPYIVLLGEAATLIALIITIIALIVQKRKKRLSYSYVTNVLINEKLSEMEELSIYFKREKINRLSVTCFKIINNGNVTIESDDVYKGHELKISPKEKTTRLISAKCISESSDTVNGNAYLVGSEVDISFQTFEVKDFLSINIYHEGDEKTEFKISGKIKEAKLIPLSYDSKKRMIYTRMSMVISIFAFFLDISSSLHPNSMSMSMSLLAFSLVGLSIGFLLYGRERD